MVWAHMSEWGMRDTPKWIGKLEHRGNDPKEDPNRLGEEDFEWKRK